MRHTKVATDGIPVLISLTFMVIINRKEMRERERDRNKRRESMSEYMKVKENVEGRVIGWGPLVERENLNYL